MPKLSIIILPLLLAGCVHSGATTDPNATSTPANEYFPVSTTPNDLILRVDTGGGLVPMSYLLTHMPQFSLYGDGRIVVLGPMIEIYPQPLLPNLRIMRVTPSEIQTIVGAAAAAGLLGPDASYPGAGIADAGTTIFTLTVAGTTHRTDAYALMADVKPEKPGDAAIRAKLLDFAQSIGDLSKLLGRQVTDSEAFEPAGLRVFVRPTTVNGSDQPTDAPTPNRIAWPLASDPATAGQTTTVPSARCVVVTGPDLATFLAAAKQATVITIWTHGTAEYSVAVRPLFPDETTCGGPQENGGELG